MMDEEPLMLSGIQHFAYCPRQWALIHIEQQWAENTRTVDGNILHKKAHEASHELRGDTLVVRELRVTSRSLMVSGICDVVEFRRNDDGVPIHTYEGLWLPYPIEYKRGEPKENDADRLQLCAQAMCLEEMLACTISEGALFYGETRRREAVPFTAELRAKTTETLKLMRQYRDRGYTPPPKLRKGCNACSLNGLCLPKIVKAAPVSEYVRSTLEETP